MLHPHQPIRALHVVGVRYWDHQPAPDDNAALDAYAASSIYTTLGVPVRYTEPLQNQLLPEHDSVERIGQLCQFLATDIAHAYQTGQAVLITGSTCTHAVGIAGGLQRALGTNTRMGIVWLDAHGDFNTPSITISGGLFGMPLAVCAGLALPRWRELGGLIAPIPTDRIILVDARNLDPAERQLIDATAVVVAASAPDRVGADLDAALTALAERCDAIYLHVDTDVLDPAFIPTVHLSEPHGPTLGQVQQVLEKTMATGKVAALTIASVRNFGVGREVSVASGMALIRTGLRAWQQAGLPA
jgi:arginase